MRRIFKAVLFVLCLTLMHAQVFAQDYGYAGSKFSIGASYLELKDELNHGLVFRGPDIRLSYEYGKIDSSKYFQLHLKSGGWG